MTWRRLDDRFTTILVLIFTALILSVTGGLSRIDHILYDTAQQHTRRDVPADVVLVTIDENSLSALGRWPWSRRLHAQLIDRLHADGARVIGLDIVFSEPQLDDRGADQMLAQAMARANSIVLPVVIEQVRQNGQLIETLPLPLLTAQAAALGRVHAELDADAIARSVHLWEGLGQAAWPHFAQAMLTVAGQLPPDLSVQPPLRGTDSTATLVKQDQRYINFSSLQQHMSSLSFVQVLNGNFTPGTFRDKLVLVGSTASGMADSLPTPVSGFQQPMPGVVFLANTLVSMRDQTLVGLAPQWLSAFLACVVSMLPMAWLPYVRARTGLLLNMGFGLLVLMGTMALPLFWHVWLPMSAGLAGLLAAYPIWAWRKLESASYFLDTEFSRLQKELSAGHVVDQPLDGLLPPMSTDPFQRRIEQVRAATDHLRQLEQEHKEALAFVSHDVRVPLASAVTQIRQLLGEQHAVHKQLIRALAATEDFLQTSRVQMLRADALVELDVISLLHEVADDIYPLAQARSLRFMVALPEEPVWVLGHFETLSRSVANLLSNALKFSPPGGQIGLSALTQGQQVHIHITDQGPGIAPQDLARLFKRFSRLEPKAEHAKTGVGLGLYFVETTVRLHGGDVAVECGQGQTLFRVQLPCLPDQQRSLAP